MRALIPALALAAFWLTPLPSSAASPAADLPPDIAQLPQTNPYRPLLVKLHSLPPEQTEALNTWLRAAERDPTLVPDEPTAALLREVTRSIATISPPATDADLWAIYAPSSLDPSQNPSLSPPSLLLGQIGKLTRIGARHLPPAESTAAYLGLARLGRSLRTDQGPLVQNMIGLLIEDQARRAVAARLNDFSAEELGQILDLWSTLPPAPEDLSLFNGELIFLTNSFRPGVKALEAELKASSAIPGDPSSSPSTFTRGLRLSGMADLGRGESWVSLENELTSQYLRLREGETAEGFTLVSVDFTRLRARLRHADGGEALLDLRAKSITELPGLLRLRQNYTALLGATQAAAFLEPLLQHLLSQPDGTEAYLNFIIQNNKNAIAHTLAEARKAKPSDIKPWPGLKTSDPFTRMSYENYPSNARLIVEKSAAEQMFLSALQLRRAALGGPPAQPAADPFSSSGAPFAYETTEDGGFILRSAFETRAGSPLHFKFGPPDPKTK